MRDFEDLTPVNPIVGDPSKSYQEKKFIHSHYKPTRFNFAKLKDHIKNYSLINKPDSVLFNGMNITPPTVLCVHGLYALYDPEIRDLATMKIFVDLDGDVRLGRWSKFNFFS